MKKLLTLTALLESGTGLGMLIVPSVVTTIILGSPVDTKVALVLSRITGIALLVIGIICWVYRNEEQNKSTKGLIGAIGVYNFGVLAVFVYVGLDSGLSGIGLWPLSIAHAVMGFWCVTILSEKQTSGEITIGIRKSFYSRYEIFMSMKKQM